MACLAFPTARQTIQTGAATAGGDISSIRRVTLRLPTPHTHLRPETHVYEKRKDLDDAVQRHYIPQAIIKQGFQALEYKLHAIERSSGLCLAARNAPSLTHTTSTFIDFLTSSRCAFSRRAWLRRLFRTDGVSGSRSWPRTRSRRLPRLMEGALDVIVDERGWKTSHAVTSQLQTRLVQTVSRSISLPSLASPQPRTGTQTAPS